MYRLLILLFLTTLLAASPMAQEEEPAESEEAPAEEETPDPLADVTDEEIEELLGLDEDYDELEDDFDPTVEVRFEDAIYFPVDI